MIFGFGSLMNPFSAEKTLGRKLEQNMLVPVNLQNYQRIWNLTDSVLLESSPKSINAVFLNIRRIEGISINGITVEITKEDLIKFDMREKHYNRIEVTDEIIPHVPDAMVYTYVGKEEFLSDKFENPIVLAKYERIVDKGLEIWGKEFREEYLKTTLSHNFKILEGNYVFKK